MNQDQIFSLVRTVLKVLGTFLATHGAVKAAGIVNSEDVIGFILAGVGVLWSHVKHAGDPPAPNKLASIALVASLSLGAVGLTGCGKATLEAGGAYAPATFIVTTNAAGVPVSVAEPTQAPDMAFYTVDSSFQTALAVVDGAFKFERDNRAALWKLSPSIKHTMDSIRPTAWKVVIVYTKARAAYIANPIPANLSTMQTALSQIIALSSAAQAGIASGLAVTK